MPDSGMHPASRPVWAEMSAGALRRNYARVQEAAGAETLVVAVVKANAYGHGAAGCAPVLAAAGAPWLGVTDAAEGVEVRRSLGILPQTVAPRVLVMCGLWPGDEAACLQANLTPVVWECFQIDMLQAEAGRRHMPPKALPVHVEIDTGMARQGVAPGAPLDNLLRQLQGARHLYLEGVYTHFASAECLDGFQNSTQRDAFLTALQQVHGAGLRPSFLHAGNTSGIDGGSLQPWLREAAQAIGAMPMTRAGLALYGYAAPLLGVSGHASGHAADTGAHFHLTDLEPVLTWKTRIAGVRDLPTGATVGYNATFVAPHSMRLALLPVGYADGFRRALSSTTDRAGGNVLLHGRYAPLVGRVSMDLCVADITDIPDARPGDEAVLLGRQGNCHITADDLAAQTGTNAYEVLCGISSRVPRRMVD